MAVPAARDRMLRRLAGPWADQPACGLVHAPPEVRLGEISDARAALI
jgi:hypothetical protein